MRAPSIVSRRSLVATLPFAEKQGAALIARALDLPRAARTADFSGSLRAGTTALRAAADAVTAGSARRVLVVASDCRMGAPRSGLEANLGDGAVAFLVGDAEGVATLDAGAAFADEIVDTWRTAGDPFVHSWEDRFVVQEGYEPGIAEAVRGLLESAGARPADFARLVLYAPDARSHVANPRQRSFGVKRGTPALRHATARSRTTLVHGRTMREPGPRARRSPRNAGRGTTRRARRVFVPGTVSVVAAT